uniref:LAGLIDADG endonuclease domain-containing protein n=1 Tax=Uncinula necator TaxID=52586 RepID=A0A7U1BF25_UNCNE|nr:LAGLIDADG endonuclease domain-containing protein [Erysiphe necator]QQY98220.1 LAGLIDADG endonuclease domain-containing protein [Erysiphe necator]
MVQYIYRTNKGAAAIVIAFNGKDLALALLLQKNFNVGNIYKPKGQDVCTYVISDLQGLNKVVNLING